MPAVRHHRFSFNKSTYFSIVINISLLLGTNHRKPENLGLQKIPVMFRSVSDELFCSKTIFKDFNFYVIGEFLRQFLISLFFILYYLFIRSQVMYSITKIKTNNITGEGLVRGTVNS